MSWRCRTWSRRRTCSLETGESHIALTCSDSSTPCSGPGTAPSTRGCASTARTLPGRLRELNSSTRPPTGTRTRGRNAGASVASWTTIEACPPWILARGISCARHCWLGRAQPSGGSARTRPGILSRLSYSSWNEVWEAFRVTRWLWAAEGDAQSAANDLHDRNRGEFLLGKNGLWTAIPWDAPYPAPRFLLLDALREMDALRLLSPSAWEDASTWERELDAQTRTRAPMSIGGKPIVQ